jgi:hypothetical protein
MADLPELWRIDRDRITSDLLVALVAEAATSHAAAPVLFDEAVERMLPVMEALANRGGPKPSEYRAACGDFLRAAVGGEGL